MSNLDPARDPLKVWIDGENVRLGDNAISPPYVLVTLTKSYAIRLTDELVRALAISGGRRDPWAIAGEHSDPSNPRNPMR